MRVGALYAVLRLEKGQFEAALAQSKTRFGAFAGVLKAGALVGVQAMAAITAGSLFAAQSFEQHMNQSLAIMGDVSDAMRKKMEDAARAVAKTTTFSANEAADAYFYLASAGYTAQQSITALPTVAEFAQAGVMDLEKATELLMDAQTTMGLRSDDAVENMKNMARVSDVLSLAQIHSSATLQQMAEALTNKVGPAARVTGKGIEEITAALMVMANRGIKGREAGTQLAIVLRELQTKAIKNKDAFKEMGVAVFDAHGEMRGLPAILGDLEDAFTGMSDEERKEALIMLGFTDRSVGFIQALLGTSDQMAEYQRMLEKAGGTTHDVATKQLNTFQNQLVITWHKIVDVAISIGKKLIPAATDLVKVIGDWIDANHDLIVDVVVNLIGAIGKVVGWIVKWAAFVGKYLIPVFVKLAEFIAPVVDGFMDFLDSLTQANGKGGAFEGIADVVHSLADAFTFIVEEVIPNVVEAVGPILVDAFETIGEIITWFVEDILPGLVELFTSIAAWLLPMIGEAFNWLATEVIPALIDAFNWFNENVLPVMLELFEAIVDWVVENWPLISSVAGQVFGAIATVVSVAWNILSNVIATVVPIIWAIIEPIGRVLLPFIGGAATVLLTIIDVVFKAIGGIWQGIADAAGVMVDAVAAAWEWLAGMTDTIWNGIGDAIKGVLNSVIANINGFLSFLNGFTIPIPHIVIPNPFGGTLIDAGGGSIDPFNIGLIPMLATGARGFSGGLAMVGENGPELVNLPGGSNVFSNAQTQELLRGIPRGAPLERHSHIHVAGEARVDTAKDAVEMWRRLEFLDG